MLNLYCGRESHDLEAFLFGKIRQQLDAIRENNSRAERVVLVVPAQYTLKAEEAAFFHLKEKGFFDLQIMSGHRLMHHIFHETGQPGRVPVNSLGRTLLLRSVLREAGPELGTFAKVAGSPDFLSMVSDLIASFKQNDLQPADVDEILRAVGPDRILHGKLADMHRIYAAYESTLAGKWIDTEDLVPEAAQRVGESSFIATSDIWYHDFYSFTRRETGFLGELMQAAPSLSVVLAGADSSDPDRELFEPASRTVDALSREAGQRSVSHAISPIPDSCIRADRPAALAHIERQLFALPGIPFKGEETQDALSLMRAGDPYAECLAIASDIIGLCASHGYRPEDIAVLTNDTARANILHRTFAEHAIPSFLDEKRTVLHHPLIRTVVSLLNLTADGRLAGDVLGFLKAGIASGFDDGEEDFENYVLQYHIRGDRFSKPFVYGSRAFGEDGMQKLEHTRQRLDDLLSPFAQDMENAATIRDKSDVLVQFLAGPLQAGQALEQQAVRLEEIGMTEASQEARQIWDLLSDLLDQVVELLGDREATIAEYRDILIDSFSDLKVGLLPQARESVLIGTVGRTRLPNVKALFLVGVNDGILPADRQSEGILTDRELAQLELLGYVTAKDAESDRQEEQLLIYQAFTKPSHKLYVSYADADTGGGQTRPSQLIARLEALFPDLKIRPDLLHPDGETERYRAHIPAALHLTASLQSYLAGEDDHLSGATRRVYDLLLEHAPDTAKAIREGLFFSNATDLLTDDSVQMLYPFDARNDQFSFSPTRLETFAGCPFKHFVTYGLAPKQRQPFDLTGREIGDVYHECLMRITVDLQKETEALGLSVTHPDSPWMTIAKPECEKRVRQVLDDIRTELFEGLLDAGKEQAYRADRLSAVAGAFVWHVIGHIRKGRIEHILTEVGFGQGRIIPPLMIPLGDRRVLIEGKIDRVDLLPADSPETSTPVKIIDYKSGQADFNRDLIARGLHLQLMVYLESSLGVVERAEPAGMFYCYIEDPRIRVRPEQFAEDELADDIVRSLEERYRMEGLFVDDPGVVESIDGSLQEGERSTVIPVRKKDDAYTSTRAVSREDFEAFRREFRHTLTGICERLTHGATDIDPQKFGRDRTACTYCEYGSICLYGITSGES
jgi:ATP-dependent helicase/nuclease subunit B